MHHHIENHGRCGSFYADVRFQLHDTIRLTAHQSDGGHIIERKTCNGKLCDPRRIDKIKEQIRQQAIVVKSRVNIFPHASSSPKVPDNPCQK